MHTGDFYDMWSVLWWQCCVCAGGCYPTAACVQYSRLPSLKICAVIYSNMSISWGTLQWCLQALALIVGLWYIYIYVHHSRRVWFAPLNTPYDNSTMEQANWSLTQGNIQYEPNSWFNIQHCTTAHPLHDHSCNRLMDTPVSPLHTPCMYFLYILLWTFREIGQEC